MGDAQAASLGVIKDGYFPVPVVLDQAGLTVTGFARFKVGA